MIYGRRKFGSVGKFEGKILANQPTLEVLSGRFRAIHINTQKAAVATWTLQVNGMAFAYIRGRSTGADADNTNGLAAHEFYNSWKDIQAGANGSNS